MGNTLKGGGEGSEEGAVEANRERKSSRKSLESVDLPKLDVEEELVKMQNGGFVASGESVDRKKELMRDIVAEVKRMKQKLMETQKTLEQQQQELEDERKKRREAEEKLAEVGEKLRQYMMQKKSIPIEGKSQQQKEEQQQVKEKQLENLLELKKLRERIEMLEFEQASAERRRNRVNATLQEKTVETVVGPMKWLVVPLAPSKEVKKDQEKKKSNTVSGTQMTQEQDLKKNVKKVNQKKKEVVIEKKEKKKKGEMDQKNGRVEQKQKKSMSKETSSGLKILYEPSSPPYAAWIISALSKQRNIVFECSHRAVLAFENGTCLFGNIAIARYLARTIAPSKLYDDSIASAVDAVVDAALALKHNNNMRITHSNTKFLVGNEISFADIVLWEVVHSKHGGSSVPSSLGKWLQTCKGITEFEQSLVSLPQAQEEARRGGRGSGVDLQQRQQNILQTLRAIEERMNKLEARESKNRKPVDNSLTLYYLALVQSN